MLCNKKNHHFYEAKFCVLLWHNLPKVVIFINTPLFKNDLIQRDFILYGGLKTPESVDVGGEESTLNRAGV